MSRLREWTAAACVGAATLVGLHRWRRRPCDPCPVCRQSHASRGRVSRQRQRRSWWAAAGRDGLDARRHDGDDRGRRRRPVQARRAAGRRVRPARAHERVRRLSATARPRQRVAGGVPPAAAPPRRLRRDNRNRAGRSAADHGRRIRTAGGGARRRAPTHPRDHPHTETAWRLRHIKRSILKDRKHGGPRGR